MSERVLLTGAGGFVGHHTLEHILVETDWFVVALDSFRHRGKTSRIREVLDAHPEWTGRVKVLTHDLRAPIDRQLDFEIGPVDYVLSVASESHVDRSITEPRSFMENNVALACTMLEWLRERTTPTGGYYTRKHPPVAKFLHISTDEVYGPAPRGHNHREGEPHRPSNPYSASKACQESIIYSYWRTYGLPIAITNTMNIIGERQDPEKFVPKVLMKIMSGETVQIHARRYPVGEVEWESGSRFYLHARNQADALVWLLRYATIPSYGDAEDIARFNVVGEVEIDNMEMAEMIADFAGRPLDAEFVDFHSSRPGHDLRYALDGGKMRELGWSPPVPLAESLRKTVEWTLNHPRWLLP
jgi:dTDP-glucose 4,6-dehydratase